MSQLKAPLLVASVSRAESKTPSLLLRDLGSSNTNCIRNNNFSRIHDPINQTWIARIDRTREGKVAYRRKLAPRLANRWGRRGRGRGRPRRWRKGCRNRGPWSGRRRAPYPRDDWEEDRHLRRLRLHPPDRSPRWWAASIAHRPPRPLPLSLRRDRRSREGKPTKEIRRRIKERPGGVSLLDG